MKHEDEANNIGYLMQSNVCGHSVEEVIE